MFKRLITWLYNSYLEELVLESLSEQSRHDSESLARLAHRTVDIIQKRRQARELSAAKEQYPFDLRRRFRLFLSGR